MNKNKLIILISVIALFVVSVFSVYAGVSVYYDDWKLEIPSSPNSAEYYVDGYSGTDSSVVIPSLAFGRTVTRINDYAFLNNTTLEYCVIPDTIKVVGNNAFYGCTSLKEIFVPDSVESLGANAFYNCSSLSNVIMSSNGKIKDIPSSCFNKCSSLESFSVPQGVESIGDFAFMNCIGLNTVVIPPSVGFVSSTAFSGCNSLTVYGWDNTYAQQYANDRNIPFVSYGEYAEPTTPPVTTEVIVTDPTIITDPTDFVDRTDSTETTTSGDYSEPTITDVSTSESDSEKGILGDANYDKEVNIKDATEIQKYIAGLITLEDDGRALADADGDGDVNIKDATAIQKHIAGMDTGYKIGEEI